MHALRDLVTNFDWSLKSITKAAVGVVIIVVALAIVLNVLGSLGQRFFGIGPDTRYAMEQQERGSFGGEIMEFFAMDGDRAATSKAAMGRGGGVATADYAMNESGIMPPTPRGGGDDAEEYERRDYSARYETRAFDETCAAVSDLKPLDYVIFDHANKSEDFCSYSFRVDTEHEDEIVAKLQALDPRDFTVNVSTVERSIEYYDSELEMLHRRLESTTETLNQAESSFNSLIAQATREGDTATLSEVINNKISTINQLSQQQLETQDRIDRLEKGRGEQIDEIEYAHFNVSVSKVTFIDGEQLADAWKQKVQELVAGVNATLLALTLGLLSFLLGALQVLVFGALTVFGAVIFAKGAWVVTRRIWHWKQ